MSSSTPLTMPQRRQTEDGQERRVGVEIELSGLGYEALVKKVADVLGAPAEEKGRYESVVKTDDGPFQIELDSRQVKEFELDTGDMPDLLADVTDAALELLDATAEKIVPLEIVCPPLPLSALSKVEQLCQALHDAGAQGSRHALHYAFGLQLNPELPGLDAQTLLSYLRAFGLAYPWLKQRHQLDISRKFTPYVDAWPEEYLDVILDPDYAPDRSSLIGDYLAHNPTRNRAMDLMPLFAHLDETRIRRKIDDPRIKPRPTLHYRLPDCDIDNPDWSFSRVWNDWVLVDDLAGDAPRLKAMGEAWHAYHEGHLSKLASSWEKESAQWLIVRDAS